jgi:hypothetical protein
MKFKDKFIQESDLFFLIHLETKKEESKFDPVHFRTYILEPTSSAHMSRSDNIFRHAYSLLISKEFSKVEKAFQ